MNDIPDPSRHSLTAQIMPLLEAYAKKFFVNPTTFDIKRLPIPGVTTVRQALGVDAMNAEGCMDYVFTTCNPYRAGGMHEFTFVPNINAQESRISKLTTYSADKMEWPADLYALRFIPDPNFPHSAISLADIPVPDSDPPAFTGTTGRAQRPRIYLQRSYLEAATLETSIQNDFYISTKPFPRDSFVHPQMIPAEIFWQFGVSAGRLLCLHDDYIIPAQSMIYQALYNTDFGSQGSNELAEQFFPRTQFRHRAPVVEDRLLPLESTFGLFVKHRQTFFPPPRQKLTVVED